MLNSLDCNTLLSHAIHEHTYIVAPTSSEDHLHYLDAENGDDPDEVVVVVKRFIY